MLIAIYYKNYKKCFRLRIEGSVYFIDITISHEELV